MLALSAPALDVKSACCCFTVLAAAKVAFNESCGVEAEVCSLVDQSFVLCGLWQAKAAQAKAKHVASKAATPSDPTTGAPLFSRPTTFFSDEHLFLKRKVGASQLHD